MSDFDYDLGSFLSENTGLDSFFEPDPQPKIASGRQKVASLGDLDDFLRTASGDLIHKSDNELWSLQRGADGEYYIERLFDETGAPIKG